MALIEKLSENLSVKLTDELLRQLRGIAETDGVSPSELARHLIEQYLKSQRDKYHALHEIFGDSGRNTK
jgi:metal-responsive CopG/Arc/MetJ family transcriptional regulator